MKTPEHVVRTLPVGEVTEAVCSLFRQACSELPADVVASLAEAAVKDQSALGREILAQMLENVRIAAETGLPLCQDTGLAVVLLELGQDVHLVGGDLVDAVNKGVRLAYREALLRSSVVDEPFASRVNTGDNTPAVIHMGIVPGDRVRIVALPKGGGAENKSALCMLDPFAGREGIAEFVCDTVERAGPSACPPLIVGVGVGGTSEYAALLAKKAILRPLGARSAKPHVASLERDLVEKCNRLGIGPMGFGGSTTVLDVFVEEFPAHIASLPVAVTIQCHSARSKEVVL